MAEIKKGDVLQRVRVELLSVIEVNYQKTGKGTARVVRETGRKVLGVTTRKSTSTIRGQLKHLGSSVSATLSAPHQ